MACKHDTTGDRKPDLWPHKTRPSLRLTLSRVFSPPDKLVFIFMLRQIKTSCLEDAKKGAKANLWLLAMFLRQPSLLINNFIHKLSESISSDCCINDFFSFHKL